MMVESIFSFLPSSVRIHTNKYIEILLLYHLFLAKGKISKSISLFLSDIGSKQFWLIRLQDFKSNISLEQNDEIVYFYAC